MKKLSIMLLFFSNLYAQKFYIETNNGYGLPFMKVLLGTTLDTSNVTTLNYGTYGGGLNFNLGVGYMFNDNIGAELMFTYLHGKNTLTNDIRKGFTEYRTDFTRMFMANPTFVAKTGGEKFSIIGKLGLVVPFAGFQTTEALISAKDVFHPTKDSSVYLRIKTGGKPALGGFFSIGAEYNFAENFAITAETQMFFLHIKSDKSKLVEYRVFGEDKYDTWETELNNSYLTTYVDQYSNPPGKGEAPSLMSSYSSLRFNLGLKYYFSK